MRTLFLGILTASFAATAWATTTFDAAADFTNTQNPNGVWSYVYAFANSSPTPFTQTFVDPDNGFPGWTTNLPIPNSIYMLQNNSGSAFDADNRYVPNDSIWMDPEGGTISTVFTAPSNGAYTVAGSFLASDAALLNLYPVAIYDNATLIWDGTLQTFRQADPFDFVLDLSAGDTLSFSVLTGTEYCTYCFLSTSLQATVTLDGPPIFPPPTLPPPAPTPEPGAAELGLIGTALIGLVALARRSRSRRVLRSGEKPLPRNAA